MRLPSLRVSAALAVAMLGLGVAIGAAIGPAPSPSFAVDRLLPLLPASAGGGTNAGANTAATAAVQPPPIAAQARTPVLLPATAGADAGVSATTKTSTRPAGRARKTRTSPMSAPGTNAPPTTSPATGNTKTKPLPPVTKVWLIELAGSDFTEAAANPADAPELDGQAAQAGTLLDGWSALAAGAFASEAALLAGPGPSLLDTIVQPPCPEGAAAAQCAPNTPGALSAADAFLKATLAAITPTAAYRENGLIVITFAAVASAASSGLPAGANTATSTSRPPAGVLLISPFVTAGAKSSTTFDPTSPTQSLERLLRR